MELLQRIYSGLVGWKSRENVPELVEGYLGGKLKVNEFVTHVLPLEKVCLLALANAKTDSSRI
jgi:Zn-dependent alcohol dehydrogenase